MRVWHERTGVSVGPQMAVEVREGCRFIPLADENAFRRVGIVQLKQHFRSRVHRAFLDHLRDFQKLRTVRGLRLAWMNAHRQKPNPK